jgi:ADP-heptose:LPS heptosyltransferase
MDIKNWGGGVHEIEITKAFLKFLGIDDLDEKLRPELWTDDVEKRWAFQAIPPLNEDIITLGIAPGVSSDPRKFIPATWFVETLRGLEEERLRIILFGSPEEKEICGEIAMNILDIPYVCEVKDLSGQTTIGKLIEGLRRCDVVLSQDTAALHIGVALGKPTVGIIGGEHYGRFYPWGDSRINLVANVEMDCYQCNWKCKYPVFKCIQEIPPQKTTNALRRLFEIIKIQDLSSLVVANSSHE